MNSHPGFRRFTILILLALTVPFLVPIPASAQQTHATEPLRHVSRIPTVERERLPNGLHILFARVNDLPLAEINIIVDAGITREDASSRGAAWTVNQMLLAGGRQRTGEMVTNYLIELGSIVIPYVHYDYAQLYGRMLAKNFSGTLGVMADVVSAPALPRQALLTLQKNASTSLQRIASSGERATMTAVQRLCGDGHVMARYLQPTPEEVSQLDLPRLNAFHAAWYRPERTTVIVTGNLDWSFVRTSVIEAFGRWEASTPAPPTAPSTTTTPGTTDGAQPIWMIPDSETPNGLAYFRLGVRAPLRGDDAFAATLILNSIVSDGPSSRLRQTFWGERVISPNFTAAVAFSRDCAYFMISGSATPVLADSVLRFAQEAVLAIARDGVTDEELSAAKASLLANEVLTFASNRNVQNLLKESVVHGIPYDEMVGFAPRLRAVTATEIQQLAQRLFESERWRMVLLGNEEKLTPALSTSGRAVRIAQ